MHPTDYLEEIAVKQGNSSKVGTLHYRELLEIVSLMAGHLFKLCTIQNILVCKICKKEIENIMCKNLCFCSCSFFKFLNTLFFEGAAPVNGAKTACKDTVKS